MAPRHSPHKLVSTSANTPPNRRIYHSRQSPIPVKRHIGTRSTSSAGSYASDVSSTDHRPVLVPLHPNLRRLPSRTRLDLHSKYQDTDMHDYGHDEVQTGSKRKRVANTNENANDGGRSTRRPKRLKANSRRNAELSSDDDVASSMDVDDDYLPTWASHPDGEHDDETGDDYLITSAEPHQLQRLRKDELVRLHALAGLTDDAELFTKSEIVELIVSARDDVASLPPSSPLQREGSAPSECSSDGGRTVDGEDDELPNTSSKGRNTFRMRRRATTNDVHLHNTRPSKGRSLSLGNLDEGAAVAATKTFKRGYKRSEVEPNHCLPRRRRVSATSSPSTSSAPTLKSPLATRLRSRKLSTPSQTNDTHSTTPPTVFPRLQRGSRGKGKQVEFIEVVEATPHRSAPVLDISYQDEDLTPLEDSDSSNTAILPVVPSPRRLRSHEKESISEADEEVEVDTRRITPQRKAKNKTKIMEEEDDVDPDEDEVDELVSSVSVSPSPRVRTNPVRRRPRTRQQDLDTAASDGDDEEEDDSDVEESTQGEEAEVEDDEETIAVEPRVLRNGKVVGDDEVMDVEEDIGEEDTEDDEDESVNAEESDLTPVDEDSAEEEEMETEDDVDLTIATQKTLIRLRRDDLVRLCETHDVEPVGTKPQLAEALLQWRDQHTNHGFSSPSSAGTLRPPSTVKRRRGRRSSDNTPPVLLRPERIHTDEPRTPPVVNAEPELELDLGTLGLEDREIPPDKITKLEKIGSGGFKDVFIGKFKGRRIAISEFRGQLSAMDIKELKLLGGFDHPNIVRFLGVSIPENTKETPVMIISELCSNGDLFDYIRNTKPPTLHKVLSIMLDIARGLEYLHLRKPSVIHRDCKSSNILITSKGTAKIADFGLAKVKQSTRSMVRSLVGTVNWQAPELWHAHPKYNHKVDVFSCAMVYWEMLQWHSANKKFPWEGMNEHAIYEYVGTKRQRPSVSGLRKIWCSEVVDLTERMWAHEHQDRPTMSEVVQELEDLVAKY